MLCWRQPFLGMATAAMLFAAGAVKAQTTPDPNAIPSWDQLQDGLSQRLLKPQSTPLQTPAAVQSTEPKVATPTVRQATVPKPPETKKPEAKQTVQPKNTPPPSPTVKAIVPRQPIASAVLKPAAPLAVPQQKTAENESESAIGKFFDRVTNFITAKPDPKSKQQPEIQPAPTVSATPRIVTVAPKAVPEPPAVIVRHPAVQPPQSPVPKTVVAQPASRPRVVTPPKPRPPTEWDKVQSRISYLPVISPDTATPKQPEPSEPPAVAAQESPVPAITATSAPSPGSAPVKKPGLVEGLMSRVTSIFGRKPDTTEGNQEPDSPPSALPSFLLSSPPSSVAVSGDRPVPNEEIETAGRDTAVPAAAPTIEPAGGFLARAAGLFADFFKPYVEPDGSIPPKRVAGSPISSSAGSDRIGQGAGDVAAILPPSAAQTGRRAGNKPLQGVLLKIGLGQNISQSGTPALKDNPNCFRKGPNKSWYCIDTTAWPDDVKSQVEVDTWLYRDGRTIVQFDGDRATRMYTLFPSRNVKSVVSHFEAQFGPATEYRNASLPIIGGPPLNNPSWRWLSTSPDRKKTMILEVREFDDERRMISDRNFGFIRLYEQGSTPIFRYLSETDLMLHQTRPAKRQGRR